MCKKMKAKISHLEMINVVVWDKCNELYKYNFPKKKNC